MEDAKEMMADKELKELAEADYYSAKEQLPKLEEELKMLLIPKDKDDDKNIICNRGNDLCTVTDPDGKNKNASGTYHGSFGLPWGHPWICGDL